MSQLTHKYKPNRKDYIKYANKVLCWAVVVAQLVERLLPIQEVCDSNPVIGDFLSEHIFTEKTKINKKRPGMALFKKVLRYNR